MMLQVGDDGVVSSVDEEELVYVDKKELEQFIESYQELSEENEQLKDKYNEQSVQYEGLEEQVERLLDFKDNVFNLINAKIKEYKKYDGYDTEKYYIGTGILKELKKELEND